MTRLRAGIIACALLASSPCAFALNPSLDISQYAHTAWRIREGFVKGTINAIAQTPDGYLWLGTDVGLYRFDGVRAVLWTPPSSRTFTVGRVRNLMTSRDGALWIGTDRGLARWKNGALTQHDDLTGRPIGRLLEDRAGVVWAMVGEASRWILCNVQDARARCFGRDGGPGAGTIGLYEDSKGTLWTGTGDAVWRWQPGEPQRFAMPSPQGFQGLTEDDDGTLLIPLGNGIARLAGGRAQIKYSFPEPPRGRVFLSLFRDRDGGVWGRSLIHGLGHLHRGVVDVFGSADGLSSDSINALFEDREGSIWVATTEGLDRFSDAQIVTISQKQGLSTNRVNSVLARPDGSVWVGTSDGLNRLKDGKVTIYRDRPLDLAPESLFQDRSGRVWVSSRVGIAYLDNDRFVRIPDRPQDLVRGIAEDVQGNLWFAYADHGLLRVGPAGDRMQVPLARLQHADQPAAIVADRLEPGVWVGFFDGGLSLVTGDRARASYSAAQGLGSGQIRHLYFDRAGALWISTDGGISRLKDGRLATLTGSNGLPCDRGMWVIEDHAESFWLHLACGLMRVSRADLEARMAAIGERRETETPLRGTLFDIADGARTFAGGSFYTAPVVVAPDGRLWFVSYDGVSIVDPAHVSTNALPPPVHIEQIVADRKTYDAARETSAVRLPALTRDLQIDYTALSLVVPERVRFRYQLEGHDREWQDAGTRRQAFYTDLPPATYRFRVIASNDSGVWNENGAVLDFAVAPAYYQTLWFRVLLIAALGGFLALLYRLREQQVARQYAVRMEERVNERLRIARELHDTLLQTFQGALLQFHAFTFTMPERSDARRKLENIIDQASRGVTEGRDAVQALRASTVVTNDLADAMHAIGAELAAQTAPPVPEYRVVVEGTSRDLAPLVRDEAYRIACEAVRNAFRHAKAARIEAEIRYDGGQLRLRVRDDGKGIDPWVADGADRPGHFGLPGMRERAGLIGATLTVWSERDAGTEVELTVPASIAYARPSAGGGAVRT